MEAPPRGTLVYDGECAFCCLWIERWRAMSGAGTRFVASQGDRPPGLTDEECAEAVQWVGADGERASGAAAVLLALAGGRASARLALRLYRSVPIFRLCAEGAYRIVAKRRPFFSAVTALFWGRDVRKPSYALGTWWFLRALGLIYLVAFVSLGVQLPGLVGERGILPAAEFFPAVREALGADAWRLAPSLLWMASGTAALLVCAGAGAIAALAVCAGVAQAPCLLLAWAAYLSLSVAGQVFTGYQWDALLLEAGLLGVLLAPWNPAPAAPAPPNPIARLLVVWLLFRLMFGSGLAKLAGGDPAWWPDLDALACHYLTQPLPTPLGWLAHGLPLLAQKSSVLAMFFVELVLPFALLGPRRLRLAAVAGLVGLQALIALTGNYGFFNLLSAALCLVALDDATLARWTKPRSLRPPLTLPWPLVCAVALVLFPASLSPFSRVLGFSSTPFDGLHGALAPFRSVNGYGLFVNMTTERREILVQGTEDGVVWKDYRFRFKPGDLERMPPVAGPHMPRLDWQMWFAALGPVSSSSWFVRFCGRLLEAEPSVLGLLGGDPFDGRRPRAVRALMDDYTFTTVAQLRATGAWWRAEPLAIYLPEVSLRTDAPGRPVR